jgi:hypothetical protein
MKERKLLNASAGDAARRNFKLSRHTQNSDYLPTQLPPMCPMQEENPGRKILSMQESKTGEEKQGKHQTNINWVGV